jgi:quinone-modifying oxidoreductase subunit QmoC
VLGAIRAYAYTHYGFPSGLAKMVSSAKNLPLIVGLPALIVLIMWILSGGMHVPSAEALAQYGFGHFFGHWDWPWLTKNVAFIDMIMVPAAGLAVYSAYRGVSAMWAAMEKQHNVNADYRPSVNQFVQQFLWPAVNEIIQHNRFRECKANANRVTGHLPLMLSFIALLFVTAYSAFTQDVLGIFYPSLHGPLSMMNPVKIVANIAAIALIFGIGVLWSNRAAAEAESGTTPTFYDWFLIYEIMAVGITGLCAELGRLVGVPVLAYFFYYLHLVAVFMLFLYMPYTKFAHMVYRTFAMAFEKYRVSEFVSK